MDFKSILEFLANNFMFSFIIIMIGFIFGWVLYNKVILKKINLRDALFEKDNLAAWIEFIGAFIFPTLFLAAKAIEGSAAQNIFLDLLICIAYVIVYMVFFTVLRLLSNTIVNAIGKGDEEGKISLNNEIYNQKNIAAALFSVALSIGFVGFIRFLDVIPEYFPASVLKMADVLVFTLLAYLVYGIILRRRTTLFKEIFVDNNAAAGVGFAGFLFAIQTVLGNIVALQKEFDFADLVAMSLISLVLFGVLSVLFKYIFTKLIKVDVWKEVYEQNNIGAAIGQVALYIGIANVIVNFMK